MSRRFPILMLCCACAPDSSDPPDDGFDPASECAEIVDVQAAISDFRTCGRASSGRVRCWGETFEGTVVGDDEPAWRASWLELELTSFGVGYDVCGATPDGALGCVNPFPQEAAPVVSGFEFGSPVEDVSIGTGVTCALLEDGTVRCWGSRLMVGVSTNEPYLGDDDPPSLVGLPAPAVGVAVGDSTACAALDTGQIACWGADLCDPEQPCGVLGMPGVVEASTPGLVEFPGPALEVSVGTGAACARLTDGSFTCWGDERLTGRAEGAGNIGDDETPAAVAPIDFGQPVEAIDVGTNAACALLADGSVRCWGVADVAAPGSASGDDVLDALASAPIALPKPAATISVGMGFACAIGQSSAVYCWGVSGGGVLGHGHDAVFGGGPSIATVEPVPVLDPRCHE